MDVLSSRILLAPADLVRSRAFYGDTLGLAIAREFGPPESRGTVYFLGNALLEISHRLERTDSGRMSLWIQVRDVVAEYARLEALGVDVRRAPQVEPWGLFEAHIVDPDGVQIYLVQIPDDHPLRRDQR